MAGRCSCASAPATGAAATGANGVSVTGAGTPASPFLIQPDAGYVIPFICTSTTRPGSPPLGQLIFETDTKLVREWTGTVWSVVPGPGIKAYQFCGGSPGAAGPFNIASGTIPDPGYPYMVWAAAEASLTGGTSNDGDQWNVALVLGGGGGGGLSSGAQVRLTPASPPASPNEGNATLPPSFAIVNSGSLNLVLSASPSRILGGFPTAPNLTGQNCIDALVLPQ